MKHSRRDACKLIVSGLAVATGACRSVAAAPKEVSITMDDFSFFGADESTVARRNDAILSALRAHGNLKAALFVAGRNIDSPMGVRLLQKWQDGGHIIANHTYSHKGYPGSSFEAFSADMLRCHELIRGYGQFRPLFRFPALKEGDTAEQRDRMRAFLAARGYRNGAVTIDASDWYIDQRLGERLASNPGADTRGYRDYYLQHIQDRSAYYDALSVKALNRSVKHTLLVHYNVLNGLYLGDLLDQYVRSGWKLIDAEVAYRDPVFQMQPDSLPAGESLVRALAIQAGQLAEPRYPGENSSYEDAAMQRLGL